MKRLWFLLLMAIVGTAQAGQIYLYDVVTYNDVADPDTFPRWDMFYGGTEAFGNPIGREVGPNRGMDPVGSFDPGEDQDVWYVLPVLDMSLPALAPVPTISCVLG